MKKLIIAAAAITMAVVANAATANWSATASNIYDSSGKGVKYTGDAYVFLASEAVTQEALFTAMKNGTDITASSVAKIGVASGAITTTSSGKFSYGDQGSKYSFFFAVIDGTDVLFSKTVTQTANTSDTAKSLAYGTLSTSATAPTNVGVFNGNGNWSQVPEPTSAMLLLLGVAGLALRRKAK